MMAGVWANDRYRGAGCLPCAGLDWHAISASGLGQRGRGLIVWVCCVVCGVKLTAASLKWCLPIRRIGLRPQGEERLWAAALRHLLVQQGAAVGDILLFRMRAGGVAKHLGIAGQIGATPTFIHAYTGHEGG